LENHTASPLFLGIDIGTSGVRAIAIDSAAQVQAQAVVDLPNAPREGLGHTQDPLIWWQALEQVLDALLRDLDRRRVGALAVDGTSATLLLADAAGTPLGHALLYDDARATDAAARIAAVAPPDSATRSATSSLAKLLYLLDQPGYAPLARHALHQADWIAGRLLGRYTHSDENNCLKLGYDPVSRAWPARLKTLGVDPALLPWPTAPG
jgi:sugar (pentulose or hexulose) kinase